MNIRPARVLLVSLLLIISIFAVVRTVFAQTFFDFIPGWDPGPSALPSVVIGPPGFSVFPPFPSFSPHPTPNISIPPHPTFPPITFPPQRTFPPFPSIPEHTMRPFPSFPNHTFPPVPTPAPVDEI